MRFRVMYDANFHKLQLIMNEPAQACLKSDKSATEEHVSKSTVHCILGFASFSSGFHRLWISGCSALRLSPIKKVHV